MGSIHTMEHYSLFKSESEVAHSCLTLCHPMGCSPPGSFIQGILQARVLEELLKDVADNDPKWMI